MVESQPYMRGDKKPSHKYKGQFGFTIVEMMIATLVFSVIMLVAAGTVVRFTTSFQRGVTATTTQNTARSIVDTVSQSLQFYGDDFSPLDSTAVGIRGYCIGSTSYSYVLGRQVSDSSTGQHHVLMEQKEGLPIGCGTAQNLAANPTNPAGQELLAPNMRLAKFEITPRSDGLFDLTVRVLYGDDDLLCSPSIAGSCNSNNVLSPAQLQNTRDLECKGLKGSQYCARSEITTTIQRRV